MEQKIENTIPYLLIWGGILLVFLSIMVFHIRHLILKYSKDSTTLNKSYPNKEKSSDELHRILNNKGIFTFSIIFVWMMGIVLICDGFTFNEETAPLLGLFATITLLSLTGIEFKKEN